MHFKTASLLGLLAAASSPAVLASPISERAALSPRGGVINNLMTGASDLLQEYTSSTLPLIATTSATVYDALGNKYHVSRTNSTLRRGIPWAGDDSVLPLIATASLVSWMHHWENPKPQTLPSDVEFYPMYWGDRKADKWLAQESAFNQSSLPSIIIAQNEPDVSGSSESSGESPSQSVAGWIKHLAQYQSRGVRVTSPQIVWNFGWLDSFMSQLSKAGYEPDIVAAHWYGSWNDLESFKAYVQKLRVRYGKPIYLTEIGITTRSNGTQAQIDQFQKDAFNWLQDQTYVEGAAWFGGFKQNQAPDNFATGMNGFYKPNGDLSTLGYQFGYFNGTSWTGISN